MASGFQSLGGIFFLLALKMALGNGDSIAYHSISRRLVGDYPANQVFIKPWNWMVESPLYRVIISRQHMLFSLRNV